jgi:hypothetical protein
MIPKSLLAVLAAAVVTLSVPQAVAQSSSDGWEFAIAPYLVAAGMDGSITVKGIEADVDVPFSDIIDNLDFALMAHFDMRNNHWVLMSDLFYVDLEGSNDVALGAATVTVQQTLFEVAGGYRVSPVFTLLGGARWVDLENQIRYTGQILDEDVSAGKSWIDPFVGFHVMAPLSQRWWLGARGDIGGVDVGSDMAWQAYADVGFRASSVVSIILGYRAIDMDYEDGSGRDLFRYDMLIAGPQMAVAFSF